MKADEKNALRRELKAALRAVDDPTRQLAARALRDAVAPFVAERVRGDRVVAALFASMAEEIDTGPLDEELRARGIARAFPIFEGDRMRFVRVDDGTGIAALPRGPMNIPTPVFAVGREVRPEDLAAVVVPGLGFDVQGGRLGRGKGYYDRVLAHVDEDRAVGVGFDVQLVPALPMDAHDVRLRHLFVPAHGVFRVAS